MSAPGQPEAATPAATSTKPALPRQPLHPGTLLVGLLCAGLMARYDPLNGFLKTSPFGGFHFSIGPMLAVLVWSLVVNTVLRWLAPRWAWSPGQTAALWALTSVPLGTALAYLVPNVVAFHYYASPANGWDRLLGGEIAPALLVVFVVHSVRALHNFFGVAIPLGPACAVGREELGAQTQAGAAGHAEGQALAGAREGAVRLQAFGAVVTDRGLGAIVHEGSSPDEQAGVGLHEINLPLSAPQTP